MSYWATKWKYKLENIGFGAPTIVLFEYNYQVTPRLNTIPMLWLM
jgi:hypothetical protein